MSPQKWTSNKKMAIVPSRTVLNCGKLRKASRDLSSSPLSSSSFSSSFNSNKNSGIWDVCRCTLEGVHRTVELLPPRCVTRPCFCSQILVDLDSQSFGSSESWDVCRCTLRFSTGPNSFAVTALSPGPISALRFWWILTASPPGTSVAGTYAAVH